MKARRSVVHAFSLVVTICSSVCIFVRGVLSEDNSDDSEVAQEINDNRVNLKDNRLERRFVNKNVINLSQRQLTKSEFLVLSKSLMLVSLHLRG